MPLRKIVSESLKLFLTYQWLQILLFVGVLGSLVGCLGQGSVSAKIKSDGTFSGSFVSIKYLLRAPAITVKIMDAN